MENLIFRVVPIGVLILFSTTLILCTSTKLAAQQSVTFYANISEATVAEAAGHIWVGFNNSDGQTLVRGFYPDGLRDDSNRSADVDYTFPVSAEAFAAGMAVINDFEEKSYLIGVRDCRRFAQSVAMALGLAAPSLGSKSPAEWLGELVDSNFRK